MCRCPEWSFPKNSDCIIKNSDSIIEDRPQSGGFEVAEPAHTCLYTLGVNPLNFLECLLKLRTVRTAVTGEFILTPPLVFRTARDNAAASDRI